MDACQDRCEFHGQLYCKLYNVPCELYLSALRKEQMQVYEIIAHDDEKVLTDCYHFLAKDAQNARDKFIRNNLDLDLDKAIIVVRPFVER